MHIRRLVTGQSATGQAVVVSDDRVAPITVGLLPGAEFHAIWGSDAPIALPSVGTRPSSPAWFPPTAGFRFGFVTLPPDANAVPSGPPPERAFVELAQKLPGMLEVLEPDHPGMHTTDTVDFGVIVAGEIWLELDDGAEVKLVAGDCVVQNGTRHAWHNRSDAPCLMAVCLLGAERIAGSSSETPALAEAARA